MQKFSIEFFPYIFVFVSAVVVLAFDIKSRKRGSEFGAMLDLVHKETVLKI